MHVLVAGAGVAGLATAIALRKEGFRVTVVERAPVLGEVGAGVVLGPHAIRAIQRLGAGAQIQEIGTPPEAVNFHDMVTGELRIRTVLGSAGEELYGAPMYQCHRRDLIDALARQLDPSELQLGRSIVGVLQDDTGVVLKFDTGDDHRGDLLVGADGLRSTVRNVLFGESEVAATGLLAWRTVMPCSALNVEALHDTRVWVGAGRHAVCYPIRRGRQAYAAFYVPADQIHREDWSASGDVAELRNSFADACPEVRNLTRAVTEAFITAINYREPLPVWHSQRVVLIGDAAHPVLPTSGSGAGVAVEDAVALAACLRRHRSNYAAAFSEFEARRKPRTTRLLYESRADLNSFHDTDVSRLKARRAMQRGVMQLDPSGYQRIAWLYGHDVVADSERPIEDIQKDSSAPLQRKEAIRAFDLWSNALSPSDSVDGWHSERRAYTRFLEALGTVPSDMHIEAIDCGGVAALRIVAPGGARGATILHLHCGGYVYGSPESSVRFAAALARAIGGSAVVPAYRLAPEHAAAETQADVERAYAWLSTREKRLLVSGACAGGGLALSLGATLRDRAVRQPLAYYLLSPFADLRLTAASIEHNRCADPWMSRRRLVNLAGAFVRDRQIDDPAISPVCGSLLGFAPVRIYAATTEALADDARAIAKLATNANVDTRLHLVDDSVHCFPFFDFLPESRAFFEDIAKHAHSVA